MKKISLKSFAKTGRFDSIEIGSLKSEVIKILGNDYEMHDGGETQIIKYGWHEFFFWTENQKLFGVQNDHLQADCTNHDEMILFKNNRFEIDKWFLKVNQDFSFSQIKNILIKEDLNFEIDILHQGCPEILKLNSGVYFDFSEFSSQWDEKENEWVKIEDPNEYILNGIRLFNLKK